MNLDRLREMRQARPFCCFVIHMADGRQVPVDHPELMLIFPRGRTAIVVQRDDTTSWVDAALITELEIKPVRGKTGRRPAKTRQ